MGTYNIPRNTKGEGRIFYIFSKKALLWTFGGIVVGSIFKYIFSYIGSLVKLTKLFNGIGIALIAILAVVGFIIGTFKMPKNDKFEITKKAAGIDLDKIIVESIKFKIKKHKLYVYDVDELSKEQIKTELEEKRKKQEKEEKLRQNLIEKANKNRRGYIK